MVEKYLIGESEHRPDLLMDLTALLECEPQDVVRFVRRHSLLWHGLDDLGSGECRQSLTDWQAEVAHLWTTVGFYLTLNTAWEAGTAKSARDYLRNLRALNIFREVIPENDRECLE